MNYMTLFEVCVYVKEFKPWRTLSILQPWPKKKNLKWFVLRTSYSTGCSKKYESSSDKKIRLLIEAKKIFRHWHVKMIFFLKIFSWFLNTYLFLNKSVYWSENLKLSNFRGKENELMLEHPVHGTCSRKSLRFLWLAWVRRKIFVNCGHSSRLKK